jgi:hypothetical protein
MYSKKNCISLALFGIALLMLTSNAFAAPNDSLNKIKFELNGYMETYYLYDFSNPSAKERPAFYVSHHQQNSFNLNIGLIRINAENKKFKAAFGLMTGSYVNANLINEPDWLKNLYEANISFKLNAKKNLWLQMGVFNSHIGFESAIGADCYTLTRSLAADNSPYFESGARINYKSKNTKWDMSFLLLNGWQKIQLPQKQVLPALGTQLTYSTQNITFNSSNYFGNEGTSNLPIWRYFHNFYVLKKVSTKSAIILGLDAGMQNYKDKKVTKYWFSPQAVYRYNLAKKVDLAARIEHYYDRDAAVTLPIKNGSLNILAASINFDYKIAPHVLFRIEYKQLNNTDPIFLMAKSNSRYNSSIVGAFTAKF